MTEASSEKTTTPTCECEGYKAPDHGRYCPLCEGDIGFPNVRAAEKQEEVDALDKRYQEALLSASSRNCRKVVEHFETAVSNSQAVFCRSIPQVKEILSSDNLLFASFYSYVRGQSRLPENNSWDPGRPGREATLFPYYHEKIQYASLSLDGLGAKGYGGCAMILNEAMIAQRASVFEENNALYFRSNKVVAGGTIPRGLRSTWNNRDRLAVAKLADRIDSNTQESEYAQILLGPSDKTSSDIIEVHIYGSIHPRAIGQMTIKEPKNKADKAIMKSLKKKLNNLGIPTKVSK